MYPALLVDVTIFVLALWVGFEVISKVPATLHTPLMSAANSIHGIVLAGAMLIAVTAHNTLGYVIAFVAAAFAAANVVGGYVVTGRMLKMFRRRPEATAGQGGRQRQRSSRRQHGRGTVGMSTFDWVIQLVYVLAASCFVLGLHLMNNPATARRGNQVSTCGMATAIAATLAIVIHEGGISATGWAVMIAGGAVGGAFGLYSARTVQMTAMPQLVSMFNAVGGGAAALVGVHDYMTAGATVSASTSVTTLLDVIIGAVTFSGSIIAAGKLQGVINSAPVTFPGARLVNLLLAVVAVGLRRVPDRRAEHGAAQHRHRRGPGVRGVDGDADRRRRHARRHLAAERVHRHRGRDGRVRHRELGADHRRRARRRVRRHPDQADGRRDEPLDPEHHRGRFRHRRCGGRRRRRAGRQRPVDRGRRRGYPARLRLEGHHRARLRPGRGAGAARGGGAGRPARVPRASMSATPSTRWQAGCRVI